MSEHVKQTFRWLAELQLVHPDWRDMVSSSQWRSPRAKRLQVACSYLIRSLVLMTSRQTSVLQLDVGVLFFPSRSGGLRAAGVSPARPRGAAVFWWPRLEPYVFSVRPQMGSEYMPQARKLRGTGRRGTGRTWVS